MASISGFLTKIKTAVYGKDVRGSLADGLEAVNKETEVATQLTEQTQFRQDVLTKKYNEQIADATDITEIKDFHVSGETGEVFQTMGLRGDAFDRSLIQTERKLKGTVNAFEFSFNGQITTQSVLDAVSVSEEGTEIKFPKGDYAFDPMVLNKGVWLNFSGSQLINKGTGDLFTFKGGISEVTYSLSIPAKRKDRVLRLNAQVKDIAAGDLILLKDDTVRHYDGLPDINSEVHEVLHVQGNIITLRDFVRLPKRVSLINVTRISPLINPAVIHAEFLNGGVGFEYTRGAKVEQFQVMNHVNAAVSFISSYDCRLSGFAFSKPASTAAGLGNGVLGMKGTMRMLVQNGIGADLRHTVDCGGVFDGLVDNVHALNNTSSQFVMSHNGYDSDQTYRNCKSYGGKTYGFQTSAQGVPDPSKLTHYGFRIIDCDVQTEKDDPLYQYAIRLSSPVKESFIENFTAVYDDGSKASSGNNAGISLFPVDNDLSINNADIRGYKDGVFIYRHTNVESTDNESVLKIDGLKVTNAYNAIVNSYGFNKRFSLRGLDAINILQYIFRMGEGSFDYLNISDVTITNSLARLFIIQPIGGENRINGYIGEINKPVHKPVTMTSGYKLSFDEMFINQNHVVELTSTRDVMPAQYPIRDGIIEGQRLTLFYSGHHSVQINWTTRLRTKDEKNILLNKNRRYLHLIWMKDSWYEV
ncbi:hypothetical protein [Peribacillus sp. FSL P2-0133]|uniref:hypothetical protein n=1 Tax=Peribacillus sp. FSL P2-0133 TaxID=2921573 RepID=UPI0030CD9CD1